MNLQRLYSKAFCIMQWNIGFCKGNIEQIIRDKKFDLPIKWLPINDVAISRADPFIFKGIDGKIKMLYEDFSDVNPSNYGTIALASIDKEFNKSNDKEVLNTKLHTSYPFLFFENNKMYVIPETCLLNKVSIFEFDSINNTLINEQVIISDMPLLDSTIFKYHNKYWLFATHGKNGHDHSRLMIYFADSLYGPYKPHNSNPVKDNINGTRPAGNIFEVDGELYRPTQNCGKYYGESIAINKITKLTQNDFEEEFVLKISPDTTSHFNAGIHTINTVGDIIVVDGIKLLFKPFTKWKLYYNKKIKKVHK